MNTPHYIVKPLKWEEVTEAGVKIWKAKTVFGDFKIHESNVSFTHLPPALLTWFGEMYGTSCDSLREAKEKAAKLWVNSLEQALDKLPDIPYDHVGEAAILSSEWNRTCFIIFDESKEGADRWSNIVHIRDLEGKNIVATIDSDGLLPYPRIK